MPKVTIYTQVYNARKYVEQCVSSVLNQTFSDFQYIIVDSASTDGSSEILDDFAAKDKRIQLIRLPENRVKIRVGVMQQYAKGEYYAVLDHDDWWDPTHLERLLAFAEANQLDIACTGTCMHDAATGGKGFRRLEHPLIAARSQFAEAMPMYYAFMRTNWGKLIRADLAAQVKEIDGNVVYGSDTIYCFQLLRHAQRIGVDNTVLHHYRIHKASQSYQYDATRFASDIYLRKNVEEFLQLLGPVSEQNRLFLDRVYSNALLDTIGVLKNSVLSGEEKLREYRTIAEDPVTQSAYKQRHQDIRRSRETLLRYVLETGAQMAEGQGDFEASVKALAPGCCAAVTEKTAGLILKETALLETLLQNDNTSLGEILLEFIAEKRYTKQYDVAGMLYRILPEDSPLRLADDPKFYRKYIGICRYIFAGNNLAALDEMTRLLFSEKRLYGEETFLQIYLTVAALENHIPTFLFGKIRLAQLYLDTGRTSESASVIKELEEMGAGEHEEVVDLQQKLRLDYVYKARRAPQ